MSIYEKQDTIAVNGQKWDAYDFLTVYVNDPWEGDLDPEKDAEFILKEMIAFFNYLHEIEGSRLDKRRVNLAKTGQHFAWC